MPEYELAYEFLAPKDTKNEDVYKVNLALEDVSGNVVTKELTLHLDGDFNAPNFSNVSPQDGTVQLLESKMELSLSFKVTDDSGLDSVYVEEPILGIMERIKLNGEKEYSFNKTYSLPSKPEEYELKITAIDNFVEANRKTQKIKYIVSSEMVTLFLADVPKGTDLTADVCGVPMLYHKKSNGIFTFKYYADCDNKEIYFLVTLIGTGCDCIQKSFKSIFIERLFPLRFMPSHIANDGYRLRLWCEKVLTRAGATSAGMSTSACRESG